LRASKQKDLNRIAIMCCSGCYVGQNIITFPEEVGLNPLF